MKLKKYLNSKNISKILALGILATSMPINSFASLLSEDGRYETFEGDNITINDMLEEETVDVEIEGNTLINLHDCNDYDLDISINGDLGNLHIEKTEKCIKVTTNNELFNGSTSYMYVNLGTPKLTMLKPDTTYTVVGDIIKNVYSIGIMQGNTGNVIADFNRVSNNMAIIKTKEQLPSLANQIIYGYLKNYTSEPIDIEVKNVMLLEGDWTNKEIPNYFEGMKSVGEQFNDNHNIEVLSRNKNLFNINDFNFESVCSGVFLRTEGQEIILNGTSTSSYTLHSSNNYLDQMKNKTTYTLSGDYMLMEITYKDGKQAWTKQITTDKSNMERITVYLQWLQSNVVFNNLRIRPMLEEGSIVTSYVTPILKKDEIILNEPLRELPNGVKDRVVKRNGKWYIERNCREVILNGSENWATLQLDYYNNKNIAYSSVEMPNIEVDNRDEITTISDRFRGLPYNSTYASKTNGFEGVSAGNICRLYIFIDKNKLSTSDTNGLKDWLKNNPTTVIYQVKEPIYEPLNLNLDLTLDLYLETTHILTNSNIPANLKFTVDRVANRAKEYSELVKENPTIENISLARMWINLMRESILKDKFQDNISSTTEVSDMVLERKTVSANLDLYIKCENLLSMSLNTNSISFEDFSGVEDMTKDSAVNISINSSLPYNINAYLPTEIQNSDKSNSMDLDILSIKENNELDYQKFSAINNKLILKSNCESGNNKQHDIDLKLNAGVAHEKDVYKTTIKFEAEQI